MGVERASSDGSTYFLVAGPAGSGLSSALESFARQGFMTVAGVSASQWPQVFQGLRRTHPRLAIALTGETLDAEALAALAQGLPALQAQCRAEGDDFSLLRLDAPEEVLAARYLRSGKRHPLEARMQGLLAAIRHERDAFACFKSIKQALSPGYYAIDTSTHTRGELEQKIGKILGVPAENAPMTIYLQSFGFKRGAPSDAEWTFDMRFIPNPYYDAALRPMSGLDVPVCDFIWSQPGVDDFWRLWTALIADVLPRYQKEGKLRTSIAIGCTGGQHRSVCMTEALGGFLRKTFPEYNVVVTHRDSAFWAKPAEPALDASAPTGGLNR